MSLASGARLGPYDIVAPLGAGGMGEVYRARDTKLHRDVAIKVLPAALAADRDRLARFEREAQALAALNHPNIAQIFGLETNDEALAIVMELVAGEDLSVQIRLGPIPVAEALPIARQIADALAAAHETGIIHRDLKPANIKVRPDGTVKVLDFGLAKALEPPGEPGVEAMNSPTLTAPATRMGVILGTAAYMAPEQARGKAVDKRADIWAFGVVLYEMLAGTRPFVGDDITDVLAAIVRAEPDWTALPAATPPLIRRLLARCLAKDVKHRLHDIADARLEIEEAVTSRAPGVSEPDGVAASAGWSLRRVLALSLATFAFGGLAVAAVTWRPRPAPVPMVIRAPLAVLPADEVRTIEGGLVAGGYKSALAWSPDGRTLAFVGRKEGVQQIYLRALDGDTARALPGTDGAQMPVFSPNGEELAFWKREEVVGGGIYKVAVTGGPVQLICRASSVEGITWGNARLVYGAVRLFEVAPDGRSTPRPLTAPQPENVRHTTPFLLPGDAAILYSENAKNWTSGDERVMVLRLAEGSTPQQVLPNAADARYLPTGHLAFLDQGTLYAVPFDLKALRVTGARVALLKDVAQAVIGNNIGDLTLAGQLAISPQGNLAYVASPPAQFNNEQLVKVDRAGKVTPLATPPKPYWGLDVSADETVLVASVATSSDIQLYRVDISTGVAQRISEDIQGELTSPRLADDGRIAVTVSQAGTSVLAIVPPGGVSPQRIGDSVHFYASSWSRDGQLIGTKWYRDIDDGDLWSYAPGNKEHPVSEYLKTPFRESHPVLSPDGRWLAYVSRKSGRDEVYVQPYPRGESRMVSLAGGSHPAWHPSGKELFYAEPKPDVRLGRRMMSVTLTDPGRPGKPVFLFDTVNEPSGQRRTGMLSPLGWPSSGYAVGKKSHLFYMRQLPERRPSPVTHINLILNWFEELKAKVPQSR